MGHFLAVVMAYILIYNDCQIFRNPTELPKGPIKSSYIFLTAVALLLYDLRLYPKHLRKLDRMSQTIVEFFIALFAMEIVMLDFWYPLENGAKSLCLQGAQKLEETTSYDQIFNYIAENLRNPSTHVNVSYTLSTFFLLAVLHAIRAVDFRALEDGPSRFCGDIKYRGKRFLFKKIRALLSGKKRVKIRETEELRSLKLEPDEEQDISQKTISDTIDLDGLSKCDNLNMECDDSLDFDSFKFSDFDIPGDTDFLLCDE